MRQSNNNNNNSTLKTVSTAKHNKIELKLEIFEAKLRLSVGCAGKIEFLVN